MWDGERRQVPTEKGDGDAAGIGVDVRKASNAALPQHLQQMRVCSATYGLAFDTLRCTGNFVQTTGGRCRCRAACASAIWGRVKVKNFNTGRLILGGRN